MFAILPIFLSSWALGGLYLSLGPSVAASIFGLRNHLVGGLVVTALCGTGALTAFALRRLARRTRDGARCHAPDRSAPPWPSSASRRRAPRLPTIGTLVAGVGFGASALACFGTLARIALPDERGELFAAAYVISYTAFSVPAVAAGFASTSFGLRPTTLVYGVVVVAFGVVALVVQRKLHAEAPQSA